MGKAYILTLSDDLVRLVEQTMRDEGIEPTRENVQRWMIGALFFTATATSNTGYRAICDALAVTHGTTTADQFHQALTPHRGKGPRSG